MRIEFLGVGEAFDEEEANTSILIESGSRILLECGYSVPPLLWRRSRDPDYIDALYLSHCHADHTFGLPAVLVRMWEDGRSRPLTVVGHPGLAGYIDRLIDLAYPGFRDRLGFGLEVVEADREARIGDLALSFAESDHGIRNFSIRASDGKRSMAFSGDGLFTDATRSLFRECDLLVHEAYFPHEPLLGHASVRSVVEMAREEGIAQLAIVHLNRALRRDRREIEALLGQSPPRVFVPAAGDKIDL